MSHSTLQKGLAMKSMLLGLLLLMIAGCTTPQNGGTNNSTSTLNPKFPTVRLGQIDGATAVYPNSRIVMLFTQAIDPNSDLNSSVKLVRTDTNAAVPISIEWVDLDNKLKITPATPMAPLTQYSVVLEATLTFEDTTTLDEQFTYEFTTGGSDDTTDANITIQNITSGNTNISLHTAWSMRFSEFVDLDGASLSFSSGATATLKAGTDGKSAIVMTNKSLSPNETVTATLSNVADLAGNSVDFPLSFTTQNIFASTSTYEASYAGEPFFDYDRNRIVLTRYNSATPLRQVDLLDYSKGVLEVNQTDINHTYHGTLVESTFYDGRVFSFDANKTMYVGNTGITHALQYNVSHAHIDKSLACFVSAESNRTDVLAISTSFENNYSLNYVNPIATLLVDTPSRCKVLDDQSILVTSALGLHKYTPTNGTWSLKSYPALDRLRVGYGYIAASSGTSVVLFAKDTLAEIATLDLSVNIKRIRIHGAFLYALEQNSNKIHVVSLEHLGDTAPALSKVGTITASNTITTFGIIDSYLAVGYATTATSATAVELFDISAYSALPFEDIKHSVGTIYKTIQAGYNEPYFVTVGDRVTYWDANGTQLFSYLVPNGPAINVSLGYNRETNSLLLVLAKGINGVEILTVNRDLYYKPISVTQINTINTNSTVFSVAAASSADFFKLIVGSTDKGLQLFDMVNATNTTKTLLKEDTTNFTAIYDMVGMNSYVLAVADYGQSTIKLLQFDSNVTDYNITDSFTTLSPPRALNALQKYSDYNDTYLFAALTAGGQIMRFDVDGAFLGTPSTITTAGYAMSVDVGVERYRDSTFGYVGLVSHLTGASIFRFSEADTQMKIDAVVNNVNNNEYGALLFKGDSYDYETNTSYNGVKGAMSFSKNGSVRLYGHQETPKPSYYGSSEIYPETNTTMTDPVLTTTFEPIEDNTSTITFDPF